MSDCSYEHQFHQDISGYINQIQSDDLPSRTGQGTTGLNTTREQVKDNPYKARPFTKLFDVGANRMAQSSLFNRATKVLMILMRDSVMGGKVYTSVKLVARELNTDESNVRKILKQLEDEDFVMKIDAEPSAYWLLNPHSFHPGTEEQELIAKRIWAIEKTKKVAAAQKKERYADF